MNNSDNDRNDNPHMTYVLHINGYNSDNHRDFLMGYLSGIYMIIYDIYIYICMCHDQKDGTCARVIHHG